MAETEVHKSKRRKNIAVLMLILGWCLLIFFVSIARMAHAEDVPRDTHVPEGAFAEARTGHQARLEETAGQWHQKWQDGEGARAEKQAALDEARGRRREKTMEASAAMEQDWAGKQGARDEATAARDAARAAHDEGLGGRPSGWWRARLNP